jgi:hypothetical protein
MAIGSPRISTGVSLEPKNMEYLDSFKKIRPFDKLSRSDVINMIIEDYKEGRGTPLFPSDALGEK